MPASPLAPHPPPPPRRPRRPWRPPASPAGAPSPNPMRYVEPKRVKSCRLCPHRTSSMSCRGLKASTCLLQSYRDWAGLYEAENPKNRLEYRIFLNSSMLGGGEPSLEEIGREAGPPARTASAP